MNNSVGNSWSTKMGLITGPVMIILGILALRFSGKDHNLAYVIITFGVIRLGLSLFMYLKRKKDIS